MIPLEPVTLGVGAALLLGVGFGSGPCTLACLPFLGPVFLHADGATGGPWRILLPFSAGRLCGYGLLGGAAGWAGLVVQDWSSGPWSRWLLGGATLLVAVALVWRRLRRPLSCPSAGESPQVSLEPRPPLPALPGGLFLMGMAMALNPCAPLTLVVMAAATSARIDSGALLGFAFGTGAVVLPTLVLALGVARIGNRIRDRLDRWHGTLEGAGIAMLLLLAAGTIGGWVTP